MLEIEDNAEQMHIEHFLDSMNVDCEYNIHVVSDCSSVHLPFYNPHYLPNWVFTI